LSEGDEDKDIDKNAPGALGQVKLMAVKIDKNM